MASRRSYSREFKTDAVKRIVEDGVPTDICPSLATTSAATNPFVELSAPWYCGTHERMTGRIVARD